MAGNPDLRYFLQANFLNWTNQKVTCTLVNIVYWSTYPHVWVLKFLLHHTAWMHSPKPNTGQYDLTGLFTTDFQANFLDTSFTNSSVILFSIVLRSKNGILMQVHTAAIFIYEMLNICICRLVNSIILIHFFGF